MSRIIAALEGLASSSSQVIGLNSGEQSWSWSEIQQEVVTLAQSLEGVHSLGLWLGNSPAWVIADLASIKAGCTCIPVPLFFSQQQVRHCLQDAAVEWVLCEDPAVLQETVQILQQRPLTVAGQELHLCCISQQPAVLPPGIAKITYTSGTTAQPKGVLLSLATIEGVALSLLEATEAGADDRIISLLPLSMLLENMTSVYVAILAGGQMLIPRPQRLGITGSSQIDAQKFLHTLTELQPTGMVVPPQLLKLLVGLSSRQPITRKLRFIAVGGAKTPLSLLEQAQQLGLPVFQGYGLSEACSVVTLNTPKANRLGSVGRVLPHCKVRIAEDGEILVANSGFQGYLSQPASTQEYLPTGDIGHLDEGYLYVDGRKQERIITSYGRNLSPEWVESELTSDLLIAQAAIFGNAEAFLSAVLCPAQVCEAEALKQRIEVINARLPDYAQVQDFVIAAEPFSMKNGQLTHNGRPRRPAIYSAYQPQLEALYRGT